MGSVQRLVQAELCDATFNTPLSLNHCLLIIIHPQSFIVINYPLIHMWAIYH